MPAWAAAQPTTSSAAAPVASQAAARGHMMDSRKGKNDAGIRGHGFVADNGVFTTIDAPGAGLFTVVFGIDESGKTVGGYIDDRGRLHGFLRDKEAFTVIDFPGARATVASKINAQGQIVGAYSENSNTPALDLPHGFLLDKGVFTKIDSPGAVRTQPFGINNWGQIVGFYLGAKVEDRRIIRGFLLDNSVFTTIEASDTTAPSTIVSDINDHGQLVGAYDLIIHGYLRDEHG
jgi:uncharacterized membrane protein